jgi:signal transduction histidine kinase
MRTWLVRLIALALIPFFGAGILAYVLLTLGIRIGDPTTQDLSTSPVTQGSTRGGTAPLRQERPLSRGNTQHSQQANPRMAHRHISNEYSPDHGSSNEYCSDESASDQPGTGSDEGLLQIIRRTPLPLLGLASGVILLCFGALFAARGLPLNIIVPLLLTACGVGISWLHADSIDSSDNQDCDANHEGKSLIGLVISIALMLASLVIYAFSTYRASQATQVLLISALMLIGVTITLIPWANSLLQKLSMERALKEREEERADMTAHLHDGVLQTLALIQLHADDSVAVSTLARSQERSLRDWLYQDRTPADRSVSSGIRDIAAAIEVEQGKAIEVVTVSDAQPSPQSEALLDATRQALHNAAKHGGGAISVYSEAHDGVIEVFVRDHGEGFDVQAIPEDRLGIRESIIGRLRRKGGSVDIVSRPGWGTEVRMRMPLNEDAELGQDSAAAYQPDEGSKRHQGGAH